MVESKFRQGQFGFSLDCRKVQQTGDTMRNIKIHFLLSSFLFLAGCAQQVNEKIAQSLEPVTDEIACSHYRYDVFQSLKEYTIQEQRIPSFEEFSIQLSLKIKQMEEDSKLNSEQASQLEAETQALLKVILEESQTQVKSKDEFLALISAIDVKDNSTAFRKYLNLKVDHYVSRVQALASETQSKCSTPAPAEPPRDSSDFLPVETKSPLNAAVMGSRLAMATAYQTCNTLKLPPMSTQSPDVDGIEIFGTHPDGVGSKRRIASLAKVQASHYYIRDERSYPQSCFNVRNNPLIYDYGGKPYATTAASSPLDFFKNNGDGTSVLGIDCSGYVFSAYAAAGLKMSSSRPLRASDSWSWGSSSYVEPQNNGLSCLKKITVMPSESLKAGDIIAVVGHVFLVDRVGADPFGISKAATVNDCSKLVSDNFDFVITQSSNSKNGIGINSFEARDYLKTSTKFKSGLEKYAYYSCLAKFNQKTYTPSLGNLSVVRHKGTSECMAPRVKLVKEECVAQCQFDGI